jgi:hypothetical protein
MIALRAVRNLLGVVAMVIAGYVLFESLSEARRYIKVSSI